MCWISYVLRSNLNINQSLIQLSFSVSGLSGSAGFCNVAIPNELLWCDSLEDWTVVVDAVPISPEVTQDEDYTYIYFSYTHSQKTVYITGTHIIPEFSSAVILTLFMVLSILVIVSAKKKRLKKTQI